MPPADYETTPYRGAAIPATSPASIALAARRFGGPRLALDGPLSVLEIGCGDGANLLPLAFFHPGWRLWGLDASARAIEAARAGLGALDLRNVTLAQARLESWTSEGRFDVVIAHGVYSWVDEATRGALRRLVRDALAPDGVAYLSFNAMPAWGLRGRVRDALVRARVEDAAAARAHLERWIAALGEPRDFYAGLLQHELTRAARASDGYLTHEYLAPDNAAFWLGEVASELDLLGLRYLGDADFATTGYVDPDLRARFEEVSDPILREEQIDLLTYRQHRAALFARERSEPPGQLLLDEAWLACALRRRRDPFDASPGVEEPFDGHRQTEVRVSTALTKVALLVMADRYPEGFRLDALVERSRALLREQGIAPEPGDEGRLRDALFRLFEGGELELRLEAPSLRVDPGPTPEASLLTRWEARAGSTVTTPLHGSLPLEPVDRALVARMDGARSRTDIVGAVDDGVAFEGAPASAAHARPALEARAEQLITRLGWWGLVGAR